MHSVPAPRRSICRIHPRRSIRRIHGWKAGGLALALICLLGASCKPKYADLTMEILGAPSSVPMGDSLSVSTQVCNRGRVTAQPTIAVLVMRPSGQPGPEFFLDSLPVPELGKGACHSQDAQVQAPIGQPDGAYEIVAIADPDAIVPEGNSANNTDTSEIGVGWGPDLVVAEIATQPTAMPGVSIQVEAQVCNQGTDWSSSDTDLLVVLSEDDVISVDGPMEPDWFAGHLDVPMLAPGACAMAVGPVDPTSPEGVFTIGGIVDQGQSLPELIETNNASGGGLIAIGYGPDLVVSAISGPPSAELWGSFEVELEVCNQGTSPSNETMVAVHLSEDEVISPAYPLPESGDPPLGSFIVPWLDAGRCDAQTLMVAAAVPAEGAWFLGAFVDDGDQVTELLESNNGGAGALMGVGLGPDYVVTTVGAPPSAADTFDAEVRVCNQGTAPGDTAFVALFLSQDTVLTPVPAGMDLEIGGHLLPGLPPGECEDLVIVGHAGAPPAGEGAYHLAARVDHPDSVAELIESNNDRWGPEMGIGHDPDLVVTAVSGPPSAFPSSTFDGSATVCNQGTVTSPMTSVSFFLSTDEQIQAPGSGPGPLDFFAGQLDVSYLSPGVCATIGGELYATVFPEGAYFLGAFVDEPDSIAELIETNNARAGAVMGVGSGPDLRIESISGPASSFSGVDIDIDFEVCNVGTLPAPESQLDLYASDDAVIESGFNQPFPPDPPLVGATIPPLAPGACHTGSEMAWLPSEVSGASYLGGIVDDAQLVPELVESNNSLADHVIGVGSAADYVVTSVTSPPSSLPSGPLPVTVKVCNQGTMPGASVELALFASEDTEIDGSVMHPGADPILDLYPLPSLSPGECHTHVSPTSPGVPDGAWYLAALVDPLDLDPELREDNNTLFAGPVGIGSAPDLLVASLGVPASVSVGIPFNVAAEVCNQGTAPSPTATLSLYHSQDAVVTGQFENPVTPDLFLDARPVAPLLPGECELLSVDVSTFATPGSWYVGGLIDEDDSVVELIETNNDGVAASHDVMP